MFCKEVRLHEKDMSIFCDRLYPCNCRNVFSDICGGFFNGMDYGSACVLGMGMYLCVVVTTCTGIIISKIAPKSNVDTSEKKR